MKLYTKTRNAIMLGSIIVGQVILMSFSSFSHANNTVATELNMNKMSKDAKVILSGDILNISVPAKQKEQLFYTIQVQTDTGIGTYILQYNHQQMYNHTISLAQDTTEKQNQTSEQNEPEKQTNETQKKETEKNDTETPNTGNQIDNEEDVPSSGAEQIDQASKEPELINEDRRKDTITNQNNCNNNEYQTAYQFAYQYNITTMPNCQKASMDDVLIRKHAAKMMANYAINVLKKAPNMQKACDFQDIQNENAEMQSFAILACKLGLMGLESDGITPAKKFNPNQSIDKAQLATILSRLLYEDTYNQSECRYCGHMEALKKRGIITVTKDMFEPLRRGRALLMLQRTQ